MSNSPSTSIYSKFLIGATAINTITLLFDEIPSETQYKEVLFKKLLTKKVINFLQTFNTRLILPISTISLLISLYQLWKSPLAPIKYVAEQILHNSIVSSSHPSLQPIPTIPNINIQTPVPLHHDTNYIPNDPITINTPNSISTSPSTTTPPQPIPMTPHSVSPSNTMDNLTRIHQTVHNMVLHHPGVDSPPVSSNQHNFPSIITPSVQFESNGHNISSLSNQYGLTPTPSIPSLLSSQQSHSPIFTPVSHPIILKTTEKRYNWFKTHIYAFKSISTLFSTILTKFTQIRIKLYTLLTKFFKLFLFQNPRQVAIISFISCIISWLTSKFLWRIKDNFKLYFQLDLHAFQRDAIEYTAPWRPILKLLFTYVEYWNNPTWVGVEKLLPYLQLQEPITPASSYKMNGFTLFRDGFQPFEEYIKTNHDLSTTITPVANKDGRLICLQGKIGQNGQKQQNQLNIGKIDKKQSINNNTSIDVSHSIFVNNNELGQNDHNNDQNIPKQQIQSQSTKSTKLSTTIPFSPLSPHLKITSNSTPDCYTLPPYAPITDTILMSPRVIPHFHPDDENDENDENNNIYGDNYDENVQFRKDYTSGTLFSGSSRGIQDKNDKNDKNDEKVTKSDIVSNNNKNTIFQSKPLQTQTQSPFLPSTTPSQQQSTTTTQPQPNQSSSTHHSIPYLYAAHQWTSKNNIYIPPLGPLPIKLPLKSPLYQPKPTWTQQLLDREHKPRPLIFVANHTTMGADMVSFQWSVCGIFNIYPRGLAHRGHFNFPLWSHWYKFFGAVVGTRETTSELMSRGCPTLVFPGGGREVMRKHDDKPYDLFWGQRCGFAKLAVQHNAVIIPIGFVGNAEHFTHIGDISFKWLYGNYGLQEKTIQLNILEKLQVDIKLIQIRSKQLIQYGFWNESKADYWVQQQILKLTHNVLEQVKEIELHNENIKNKQNNITIDIADENYLSDEDIITIKAYINEITHNHYKRVDSGHIVDENQLIQLKQQKLGSIDEESKDNGKRAHYGPIHTQSTINNNTQNQNENSMLSPQTNIYTLPITNTTSTTQSTINTNVFMTPNQHQDQNQSDTNNTTSTSSSLITSPLVPHSILSPTPLQNPASLHIEQEYCPITSNQQNHLQNNSKYGIIHHNGINTPQYNENGMNYELKPISIPIKKPIPKVQQPGISKDTSVSLPICFPNMNPFKWQRHYFIIGDPIDASEYDGLSEDEYAIRHLRDRVKTELERVINEGLEFQENDPNRYTLTRWGNAIKTMFGF